MKYFAEEQGANVSIKCLAHLQISGHPEQESQHGTKS